jgi:hypothetical protein
LSKLLTEGDIILNCETVSQHGGNAMPQRLIDGTSFGPEVLKVVRQAFDEAWLTVADRFAVEEHNEARGHLAEIVMNVAREDSADAGRVRDAALRALERHYPMHFDDAEAGQSEREG